MQFDIKHVIAALLGAALSFGLTYASQKLGTDVKGAVCNSPVAAASPSVN